MEGSFSYSHSLEVFPKWVLDTLASLELVPVTHVNHVTHVTHVTHDSICSSSVASGYSDLISQRLWKDYLLMEFSQWSLSFFFDLVFC